MLRKAGGRAEEVGVLALKFKETSEIGLMTVITVLHPARSCQHYVRSSSSTHVAISLTFCSQVQLHVLRVSSGIENVFPWLACVTDASVFTHCTRSRVINIRTVPTTRLIGRHP